VFVYLQRSARAAAVKWTAEIDRFDFTTGPECNITFLFYCLANVGYTAMSI